MGRQMLDRFKENVEKHALVSPGERILVGYSGGADSACLLDLMHVAGYDVIAAHLHHGMREDADAEAEACQRFCDERDIPMVRGQSNVPELAEDMKVGLEEAGRHARYAFFRQAAFRTECSSIATAHTLDDHVETVLLNLSRGSGMSGMTGIPMRRDSIIRPLLCFSRDETRSYCRDRGLWFHDDPANADVNFSRTRIRLRVIPELEKVNSAVRQNISRMAEILEDEDRFLNGMAASHLEQAEIELNGDLRFLTHRDEAAFSTEYLRGLPKVLCARAIRLAGGFLGDHFDFRQVELILEGIAESGSGSVTAEGGRGVATWNSDRLHVWDSLPTAPYRYGLTVPGETSSDEFGWEFVVAHCPPEVPAGHKLGLAAYIDEEAVKGSLHFRTFQEGDKMTPLGMTGSKKVSDILSEMKLTSTAKAVLPIVCDMVGIVWIPNGPIADRVKIQDGTRRALRLTFGPLGA